MGRYRRLHGINSAKPYMRSGAERQAINTPIQAHASRSKPVIY